VDKVVELANANSWLALSAMDGDALRTARELREVEPQWAGVIYSSVGNCYNSLGQYAKAMELFEQSLAINEELGDRAGQGTTLHGLGNCFVSLGQSVKAIELFEQSLAIFKELVDRAGQGAALNGLGMCYRSLGQYAKAIELFEQCLAILEELGDRAGQGTTLGGLGMCYRLLGQYAKAIELFDQALTILKELGDRAGQGTTLNGLGNCYYSLGQYEKAMELFEQSLAIDKELGDRAGQGKTLNGLGICYQKLGQSVKAIDLLEQSLAILEEVGDRAGQGKSLGSLGNCYQELGHYVKAIERYQQFLTIAEEVGDREGQGAAYNGLGLALAMSGDGTAAARALARGLVVWQRVEQDVGEHDDRRVSVFEQQQKAYMNLQGVLLGQAGQAAGWALGVAAEGKGRALAYRLGAGGGGDDSDGGNQSVDRLYEDMCGAWWAEVQRLARAEGAASRVLEYSFVVSFEAGAVEERLAIWVVSGATGELLCSRVVASTGLGDSRGRSIQELLTEARSSMNVRGRDATSDSAPDTVVSSSPGVPDAESTELPEELQSTDADAASAQRAPAKDDQGRKLETKTLIVSQASRKRAAEMAREVKLLQELHAALIAPVEGALDGAEELLILPHKELFEVPWAALIDSEERYLIERYIIRTAPSLRVARQAADKMQQDGTERHGHVVLVGNPLPTRLSSLRFAEKEVEDIKGILNSARLVVLSEHYFRSKRYPHATKTNVKSSLEGAAWAHMALHGDLETDALVLADACGSSAKDTTVAPPPAPLANRQDEIQRLEDIKDLELIKTCGPTECAEKLNKEQGINLWTPEIAKKRMDDKLRALKKAAPKSAPKASDLSMHEVQGSEGAQGVRLAQGATVVLSACNTGRGEIKAEGVVGLARGFLLANASATVVSLWSVDDGSTAALMRIKYQHLAKGCTVPQALRLAMLRLARPRESLEACQQGRQAARDSGQCLDLSGDFMRQDGDGAKGSSGGGSGGLLPGLQPWIEMLGGGTEAASRCAASSSAAAHAATHTRLCETEAERRQYWREFCKRDVAPTCVLDFAYVDHGHGGLNLSDDDSLLERLYCFEDREDNMHLLLGGRRRRVILKVHTLRKWRERGNKLYERASKVTAVKFMYAYWYAHNKMFEMDQQSELKLLPVSEQLQDTWRDAYRQKRYGEIEWEWRNAGSMPSAEPDTDTAEVKQVYDDVRAAIRLGESIFYKGATATDKSMQGYHSVWKETHGVVQVFPLFLSHSPAPLLPPSLSPPFLYVPPSLVIIKL
jgi:CHAT domain-containing protein/tetratricopeptide (TPR) repeat protein